MTIKEMEPFDNLDKDVLEVLITMVSVEQKLCQYIKRNDLTLSIKK